MSQAEVAIARRLRAAGSVFAEDEADVLLDAAAGDADRLAGMIERRVAGEPLEVIVGWAEFRSLRIHVAPGVFVPRRRTELVVETALGLPALRDPESTAVVLDLCCGTGAVGAAIRAVRPAVRVVACDLDERSVAVARLNLGSASEVHQGDLFAALPADLRGSFDVIVANAPYVPHDEIAFLPQEARLHEPLAALDGGATGTELHERIAAGSAEWLTPRGVVVIETSPRQALLTRQHLERAGFSSSTRHSDDLDGTVAVGVHRSMPTKITFVYDNPTDPDAFEAAYPDALATAKTLPGIVKVETSRVWPKEDGSPTPAYRLVDLYFADYDSASAAVATEQAGELFPAVFALASGGVRILFADVEEGADAV